MALSFVAQYAKRYGCISEKPQTPTTLNKFTKVVGAYKKPTYENIKSILGWNLYYIFSN